MSGFVEAVKAVFAPAQTAGGVRDVRLDFFRGLALWFIYVDHVPENAVSWLTVRNYGFSDATEIFVFISGYTAVVAYASIMRRRGWLQAAARIFKRVWQLYVAHIMLFVAFVAQIAYVAIVTNKTTFLEEMELAGLLGDPSRGLLAAALLQFRPVNLDVLPLYIALLAVFPFTLPAVLRFPWSTLAGSLALYLFAREMGWNLPGYPDGKTWYFNPFGWQFLFYLGAAGAALGNVRERSRRFDALLLPASIVMLLFAGFVSLGWYFAPLGRLLPNWLGGWLYPIDKTHVDLLRILHFLAMAYLVGRFLAPDAAVLRSRWLEPVVVCGKHSLQIFCLGTFLSFTAWVVLEQIDDSIAMQIAVTLAGLIAMTAVAYGAEWYKRGESGPVRKPSPAPAQ